MAEKELPERPIEGEGPDGPASAPSKNALKKAAKEKEKAGGCRSDAKT